jgi:hypothetical protein
VISPSPQDSQKPPSASTIESLSTKALEEEREEEEEEEDKEKGRRQRQRQREREKKLDERFPPLTGQSYPINEVLKVWRHTKVVPGVRVRTFAALVVLGTGAGTAGLGYGKGKTVAKAIEEGKISLVLSCSLSLPNSLIYLIENNLSLILFCVFVL